MTKKKIACPTCKKIGIWSADNPTRPFCSERCKLIDLGEWADEKFKIPLDPDTSDEDVLPKQNEDE